MRKILAVVVVLAFILSGCAEPTVAPTAVPAPTNAPTNKDLQKGKPFRFISPNRQHPVVRTMALGFADACKKLDVLCEDDSFEGVDFTKMPPIVDAAIAQGSSGAIPFVDKAVLETDKKIVGAGIPSIAIHTQVDSDMVPGLTGWVAADASAYAKAVAVAMGDKMGGKGVVAITQGDLNDVENKVSEVFTATLKEKYPNIKVIAPTMEGFDQPQAIQNVVALLQAHPEITAAFGTTGYSPVTWAKAAQQSGKKPGEILIVGMDFTSANLDLVDNGEVYAIVAQPLYSEVYHAVELLVDKLNGKPVAYSNVIEAPIVTKGQTAQYRDINKRVDAK